MRSGGWSGKGRGPVVPQWKLEARKIKAVQRNASFSMGGLPRARKPTVVSLPKLNFQEDSK